MASQGFIETLLSAFQPAEKKSLSKAFEEVTKFIRFGDPSESAVKAENLSGAFFTSTTSGTAGNEVAIAHQLGTTPYMLVPVMPLNSTAAQVVPLQVTRAADDQYVYVKSTSTGARFSFYLES